MVDWKKTVVVGGVAALLLAGPVLSANAADASGACSVSGHNGTGRTYWARSGSVNKVSRFQYQLTGHGTGGKSNVHIDHYENRTLAGDRKLHAWDSPDNLKNDTVYNHDVSPNIQLDATKKQHSDYTFWFDRAGSDPSCKARTSDFK